MTTLIPNLSSSCCQPLAGADFGRISGFKLLRFSGTICLFLGVGKGIILACLFLRCCSRSFESSLVARRRLLSRTILMQECGLRLRTVPRGAAALWHWLSQTKTKTESFPIFIPFLMAIVRLGAFLLRGATCLPFYALL